MARPRNPDATPNTCIIKRKNKDGSYRVYRKISLYDPKIKNTRSISEERIGTLPANYTDEVKDLQPYVPKKKKRNTPVHTAVGTLVDDRETGKIQFPLAESLMVIVFAFLCGCSSCLQVEGFWMANLKKIKKLMPSLPSKAISHDTVRRFIMFLGRDPKMKFFQAITSPLVNQFKRRRISIDGQAVRASTLDGHRSPYIFNAFDADNGLVLNQTLIDAKENEISKSIELVEELDLHGCVLTCDALNTQRKFVKFLIEDKSCDYCLAVKSNHKSLYETIQIAFSNCHKPSHQSTIWESKATIKEDKGHGRKEKRKLRVMRGSSLPEQLLEQWHGLAYGTIVEATTDSTDLKSGKASSQTRYFISSLNYEEKYIAEKLAHVIRGHWAIENQVHWNLDVTMDQDHVCCRNADFLKGITLMNKITLNIQNRILTYLEEEEKITATRPMLMKLLSDIDWCLDILPKIYEQAETWNSAYEAKVSSNDSHA